MAEYKYKALGWKDDDIASLNVVDGTAADNQVELQITKQGAGGTIDGPAIFGKDGITINKAADSEKIEISGSGCVQINPITSGSFILYGQGYEGNTGTTMPQYVQYEVSGAVADSIAQRRQNASLETVFPDDPNDLTLTNKKYVDDNYVKKSTNTTGAYLYARVLGEEVTRAFSYYPGIDIIPIYNRNLTLKTNTPVENNDCANKKYVDEADKDLRLKLSNLEQALNGYILDTTKETYADLDSAVLKNSVAVGNNVYPIADKTRALVTRIEGKTTKMVQLANTETLDNEQINNGITLIKNADGSLTANGTATAKTWGLIAISRSLFYPVAGSKYLLLGSPDGYGRNTYDLHDASGKISEGEIKTLDGSAVSIRVVFAAGFVAENITFRPQLFNLTAIYGEGNEPTTVEQFKADFPNAFYPYAEGNIYPAKISGVKFYEKQDKSGEQASVTLPETYELHGIGDYKDYLEITKNENNELYTLKKVQVIDKHIFDGSEDWSSYGYDGSDFTNLAYRTASLGSKFINWRSRASLMNLFNKIIISKDAEGYAYGDTSAALFIRLPNIATADEMKAHVLSMYEAGTPYIFYGAIVTPVETVIATNLTYEQVTAIRHNGGLIEVEGNTNKGYARPTVTNTIVYRLTAANTTEG